MKAPKASRVGYKNPDGTIGDTKFHEEILAGVDDTPLRIMSAWRAVKMGLTREQAEEVFNVKLPNGDGFI
jgi:hypothetical protein